MKNGINDKLDKMKNEKMENMKNGKMEIIQQIILKTYKNIKDAP